MNIKLLLVTAVIGLTAMSSASADSDHRTMNKNSTPFSFNLIIPAPTYIVHRSYAHQNYHNNYRYRHNYRHHHHHDKPVHRNSIQGFKGTR